MHRIDGAGHIDNKFTEGDPLTATPATQVTDNWLNDVQENIIEVIDQAGTGLTKDNETDLYNAIQSLITANQQIAQPFMHVGESPPPRAIELGGYELSRITYASLWNHINNAANNVKLVSDDDWLNNDLYGCYSLGDGSTTFRLPDVRGEFIRAWDNGKGIDIGRLLGSYQTHAYERHRHDTYLYDSGSGNGNNDWATGMHNSRSGEQIHKTGFDGGTETRPRNIAWMICIYYQ